MVSGQAAKAGLKFCYFLNILSFFPFSLHSLTASARVTISAANGAIQIEPLPKTTGIQKMAKAFITIPLLIATMFAASVLLVENRKAV